MEEGKITPLQFLEKMHNRPEDSTKPKEFDYKYVVLLACYLPICEYDANAAIVLARIVFWNRGTLRVHINKIPVLAKSSKEMCEETGLRSRYIVERAYEHLKELGIITTTKKKFNKAPTLHISLHLEVLFQRLQRVTAEYQLEHGLPITEIPSHLLEKPKMELKKLKVVRKEKVE